MSAESATFYEFGSFRLDAKARLLWRNGELVHLTPKAVETLLVLMESEGGVISRDELIRRIWPDAFVEEGNLSVHISALRKALGQTDDGRPYIETLPRRGYRFIAKARRMDANSIGLVIERGVREQLVVIEDELETEANLPPTPDREALDSVSGVQGRRWRTLSRATLFALAAALSLGLGLLFYARWTTRPGRPAPASSIKSIAVLPLKQLGQGEQGENYLGVGLADALITRLGGFGDISVRPTSAVLHFDDPKQDSLAAARALGVDAVLEGSYQRESERIRVTVQLVSAKDGTQLWSGAFDDEFNNIFAVQDSLSQQVTQALVSNLDEAEQRVLARRPSESVEAYQLYLKGRYFWTKKSNEGLRKALQYFEQAVQIDPRYARAYSGLADCYLGLSEHGLLPRGEVYSEALAAAEKAISLDPALADPHTTLGFIHVSRERDYSNAEREFKRAIELDPNYATARQFYGVYLLAVGQRDAAIAETRRALELDPLSLLNNTQLGRVLYLAGRYDEAIEQSQKTLELDSSSASAHVYLGQAYAHKGMLREAAAELEEAVELSGGRPEMKAALGYTYALSGKRDGSQKIIAELSALDKNLSFASYHIATIYAGFPEKEQAFAWLQKAYEERDIFFNVRLKTDPKLDSLRSDPRFAELLRGVGLAP